MENEQTETMLCDKLAEEIKFWIQHYTYKAIDEKPDKVYIHCIDSMGYKSITYAVSHDFYKQYFSEVKLIKS